jgi:3-methyladenine DNA glycosylase AlkD
MLHPEKARVAAVAAGARRALYGRRRPAAQFDASRYFRGAGDLVFLNVGSACVRTMAREIVQARRRLWTVAEAMEFAAVLMPDRALELKQLGVEVVARFRREFTPRLLGRWKRWLANDDAANWATTDAICGMLIGPLLERHPDLIAEVRHWATHRNLWVRRAAAVGLVAGARRGRGLDEAYAVAASLHHDSADLIQKAAGWLLREAGKTDMRRLDSYLRKHGCGIPRTTVRYAIEKFPAARRRELLSATRPAAALGRRSSRSPHHRPKV